MFEKAVIGLGNPGAQYVTTRHNIGFLAIDRYLDNHASNSTFKEGRFADFFEHQNHVFVKPLTFMNKSGIAIGELYERYRIEAAHMLVVFDDYSLPFGSIRLRKKGGSGGQNGMESIIRMLGTQEFPRLRLGIADDLERQSLSDYVLGQYSPEQEERLDSFLDSAAKAIDVYLREGIDSAMNKHNTSE